MNPFDLPPAGAPVSFETPVPEPSGPRRGRTALIVVLTAGLIGGGLAGISALASADGPELGASTVDEPADEPTPPADDADTAADPNDEGTGEQSTEQRGDDSGDAPTTPGGDGRIVLDVGEGDPIVLDLGELADGDLGRLTECLGFPMFDFDLDLGHPGEPGDLPAGDIGDLFDDLPFDLGALGDIEWGSGDLGPLGGFGADGSVTVMGPDGVSVIDLGENGSVTVTKEDGEVSVSTEGDATVTELADVFGDLGKMFDGEFDFHLDDGALDEFFDSLPNPDGQAIPTPDDRPEFQPVDPDAVRACLDDIIGR